MRKEFSFLVFFEPLDDGGYMVVVPSLPGIVTYGENLEEARTMAHEAIQCHIEGMLKDGETIPEPSHAKAEPIREVLNVGITAA